MDFYKYFLQGSASQDGRSTGIHLAIFGKHPGWDDHIPDIGLTTETLVLLKRVLYVRGIGGLIDAGAWDNLAPEDVLDGFDHTFFGQQGNDAVVGRMWPSKDGKGRARYPMVVVAHLIGLPLEKCLPRIMGLLDEFHGKCIEVQTDEAVLEILSSTQAAMNQLASELAAGGQGFVPSRRVLQRMLERQPLVDETKHRRLLYEVRNKLEPFSSVSVDKSPLDDSHPGEHIRLPMDGFRDLTEGFIGWLTYLRTQVSSRMPILLLAPKEGEWLDAIVGLFTGAQLRSLRSSLHHLPPVTEIEYNIPEDFAKQVSPILSGIADWQQVPNEKSVFGPPSKARLGKRMVQAATRATENSSGGSGSPLSPNKLKRGRSLVIGSIAGVILLLVIVLLSLRGCGTPSETTAELKDQTQKPAAVAEGVSTNLAEACYYLANANEWFPRFMRYARNPSVKSAWERDADLNSILLSIERPEFYSLLDQVGTDANLSPAELGTMDRSRQQAIIRLAAEMRKIEAALSNWSVGQNAGTILAAARENGWTPVVSEVGRMVPPLQFNRDLGPSIQEKLAFSDILERTAAALKQNEILVGELNKRGLASLADLDALNARALGDVSSLAVLNDALAKQNQVLEGVQAVVSEAGSIDEGLLMADPRFLDKSGSAAQRLTLLENLLEDYQILDPSEIPEFDVERIFPAKQLESQLSTLTELEPGLSLTKYRDRWQDAAQRLEAVSRMPRVKVNRRDLLAAHKEVLSFFSSLRSELGKALADRSDPTGWHANLASFAPDTPALGESWRRRVEELVPLSDLPVLAADNGLYIERRQRVDKWVDAYQEMEAFLQGLQLPELPKPASRERQARFDVINDHFKALATESIVQFMDGLSQPFAEDPGARAAFVAWQSAMEAELREPLSGLETGLNELESSLEGDGQGTFAGQIALMDRFWPKGRPAPELDALYLAAKDLSAVGTSSSAPELFRIFEKSPWSGVRWAVWRKARELDTWPNTKADLDYARELGLRMNASGLSPEDLDNTLYLFWQGALIKATDRKARFELWDFMDEREWNPGQLPQAWQYDRLVCKHLQSPIARVEREEALAVRDSFIQSLNALESVTSTNTVRQFISNLNQLTFEQGRHIDPELLEQAGPGNAGWRMQGAEPTGKWVQYVWASESLKVNEGFDGYVLSFSLVESAGGDRFYLSTDEVAAGLFFDWIVERTGWNSFRTEFPDNAFGSDQPQKDIEWRRGPRAWTLEEDGTLAVAYDWQLQSNTQGVPLAPGIDQRPSRFSPMNYLTGSTALEWAASLACRLPTTDEFVMAREWPNSDLADSNLRDATWARQLRYLVDGVASPSFDRWPDLECFAPDGILFARGKDAKAVTEADDGLLWFREVGTPGADPSRILNLHGNVAEFLSDTDSGQFVVIGASAISPAEVAWMNPYPVPGDLYLGFSDVGFRMAFDAPVPLPGRILLEAFGGAPELPLN